MLTYHCYILDIFIYKYYFVVFFQKSNIIPIYIIIIRKGIPVNLLLAGAFAGAFAGIGSVAIVVDAPVVLDKAITGTIAIAGVFAVTFASALASALAIAAALAVTKTKYVTAAAAFTGITVLARTVSVPSPSIVSFSETVVIVGVGIGVLISAYVAWQAIKGDEKYTLVRNVALAFAAIRGTSFHGADLTDADFTEACLKSTDLRKAKLIRTCFQKTKLLDRVRPGTSYLQHPKIRQLILTGQGQDKIFDRFNLRGINLKGAFLTDASFIYTDLSHACLQDADLSRAKLAKTQLYNTNFTGATLTGIYIGHWNISNETNFCGVKCEYVYTRTPTKENPNPLRKPDNNAEVFADGEFGDFIQPIFDTLDLYHNQGVDPRVIAISFKELAENNPDAQLQIVGMEVKGEDKFLLRAKTTPLADKSELSAEYFEIYNQVRALAQQEVQALMAEKDSRICSLETMVVTALKSPSFYAEGDARMSGDNIQQQGSFGIGINKGEIKAENIAGTINEAQQQSLAETAAEIQELLKQLEKSYPTETTTGKMALAAEVMAQIDSNPNLKARILSALKVGSVKAFEQFLSHPAASFVIGALEDWQKTKGS